MWRKLSVKISRQDSLSWVPKLFLLLSILVAPFFVFLSAPFQAPDESAHYWRAYELSELDLFADKDSNGNFGYPVPRSVALFAQKALEQTNPRARLQTSTLSAGTQDSSGTVFVGFDNAAIYSPVLYVPQIVGIWLGKLLHAPPIFGFYAGRVLNYSLYVLCAYLALRLIPIGRRLFFVLALLPMSLFLAASLSPDATIIGASLLTIAFGASKLLQKSALQRTDLVIMLGLGAVLSLTKMGYFLLAYIYLLIPHAKFSSRNESRFFKSALVIITIALALTWSILVAAPAEHIHTVLLPGTFVDTKLQLQGLLHGPFHFLGTVINTYLLHSSALLYMSFVGVFGWLDITLPFLAYVLLPILLTLAFLADNQEAEILPSRRSRIGISLIAIAVVGILSTTLYLGYSQVGAPYIDGLQGRYFIPIAALLLPFFITKRISLVSKGSLADKVMLCFTGVLLAMAIFSLINVNVLRIGY